MVLPCGDVAAGDRTGRAPEAQVSGDQIPKDHAEELGDSAAYAPGLFGYACALTQGDHALADDLVQAAFMAAAPQWPTMRCLHDAQRLRWLHTTVGNLAISAFRRNKAFGDRLPPRGQKCVSVNEPYFQGHFPGYPVMPGALILEALVQLSTLLAMSSGQPAPGAIRSLDDVRFKRQVTPGDRLTLLTRMQPDGRFEVRASVDGELATEGTIVLAAAP